MARSSSSGSKPNSSSMSSFRFLKYCRSLLASCGRSSCGESGRVQDLAPQLTATTCKQPPHRQMLVVCPTDWVNAPGWALQTCSCARQLPMRWCSASGAAAVSAAAAGHCAARQALPACCSARPCRCGAHASTNNRHRCHQSSIAAVQSGTHLRRAPVRQKRRKPESGPLEPSYLSPIARLSAAAAPLRALLLGSPFSALLSSAAGGAAGSGSADGPSGAAVPCNTNSWLARNI